MQHTLTIFANFKGDEIDLGNVSTKPSQTQSRARLSNALECARHTGDAMKLGHGPCPQAACLLSRRQRPQEATLGLEGASPARGSRELLVEP